MVGARAAVIRRAARCPRPAIFSEAHLGFLQVLRTQAREIKPARRGTGGFCAGVGFEVTLGQENGPEGPGSTLGPVVK